MGDPAGTHPLSLILTARKLSVVIPQRSSPTPPSYQSYLIWRIQAFPASYHPLLLSPPQQPNHPLPRGGNPLTNTTTSSSLLLRTYQILPDDTSFGKSLPTDHVVNLAMMISFNLFIHFLVIFFLLLYIYKEKIRIKRKKKEQSVYRCIIRLGNIT